MIAIVGGGAAGALTAIHISAKAAGPVEVVVVEPRASVGRGVAYGTTDPRHLLNVPADRLSAFSRQPLHFETWNRQHRPQASDCFVPRAWFGDYLSSLAGAVDHIRDRVVDIVPSGRGVQLVLDHGRAINADRSVLAPGSSPPVWPAALASLSSCPAAVEDPWLPGALDRLPPHLPVTLIGSGLTAVDVALTLRARGHRQIVAVSRHGLLPSRHLDARPPATITAEPRATARGLIRWYRDAVADHGDWRAVVDGLRPHTDRLWAALTDAERSRLLRHSFRAWEVARHRMAPQTAASIAAMEASGELTVTRGAVRGVRRTTDCGLAILVDGQVLRTGSVVNCTGPVRDVRQSVDPLVRRMLSRGAVRPGPLNLGLEVSAEGEVPGSDGRVWVVGSLRRGNVWETTAVPEIRAQAEALFCKW